MKKITREGNIYVVINQEFLLKNGFCNICLRYCLFL